MRRRWTLLFCLLPAMAWAESTSDEAAMFDRLTTREQILDVQHANAESTARKRGLLAYRLCRRRELGFATNPERRLEDARAFDLALVALQRSAGETSTLSYELDRLRSERTAIEAAFVARATAAASPTDGAVATTNLDQPGQLLRPVRGEAVAMPGARRDGSTKVELRHAGVKMLARLNEPVRAVAAGIIRRVEALPQGGFAVVTTHATGMTSIVTGLRDISVAPGDKVSPGQALGLAGRNLDGAAVVSIELWSKRHPLEVGKLLKLRLGRSL
jgi:murein DD-endopeptidase MepM/ murein hydrolase activator NlpD